MKKFFCKQKQEESSFNKHCDYSGCDGEGMFRAPKSRGQVGSNVHDHFHWFCLDHVREYNKSWDYFDGMSNREAMLQAGWSRPTWPMGRWSFRSQAFRHLDRGNYADPFGIFNEEVRVDGGYSPSQPNEIEAKALAVLDMEYPYDFDELRAKYLLLIKKFHPDANGGAAEAEEYTKRVNEAYVYLKERLASYRRHPRG